LEAAGLWRQQKQWANGKGLKLGWTGGGRNSWQRLEVGLGWTGLNCWRWLEAAETVGKPAERSEQRGERQRDLKTEKREAERSQNREEKINLGPAE
jgi:hypothetical protein